MTKIMRKIMMALVMLVSVAAAAQADTIYMRNGSSMQGKCVGFEDGYFLFELSNGNQAKYLARDVSRLVIESRTASDDTRYRKFPWRDRNNPAPPTGGPRWESTTPFDVRLQDQWIRSQVQVRRGQRVRVEASGTVTLEGKRTVNPDGQANSRPFDSPMPNQNDGALIAVIGKDEDAPPIFIGRQREFVAERDGMLYFTVNHWETSNAGGAFRVTISVDRNTGGSRGATQRREKVITVPGNKAWVDTGIDLDDRCDAGHQHGRSDHISQEPARRSGRRHSYNNKDVRYPINSSGVGALIAKVRYSQRG